MRASWVLIASIALAGCAHQPPKVVGAKATPKIVQTKASARVNVAKPPPKLIAAKPLQKAKSELPRKPKDVEGSRNTGPAPSAGNEERPEKAADKRSTWQSPFGGGPVYPPPPPPPPLPPSARYDGGDSELKSLIRRLEGLEGSKDACDRFPTICGEKQSRSSPIGDIRKGGLAGGENSLFRKALRPFNEKSELDKSLKEIVDKGKGDIKSAIPVLFATNRVVLGSDQLRNAEAIQLEAVTSERSDEIVYGRAIVSIPKNHKIGTVKRPEYTWYKFATEAETDEDHFRLKQLLNLSRDVFMAQLKAGRENSVVVFVHGYRVPFEDALYKSAQIAFDAGFQGSVAAFSWPSRGKLLAYDYDEKSAEFSAGALLELLKIIKLEAKVSNIYIVAHSLGSRIVVDALHQAALTKTKLNVSELVFAAPDVDKDVFRSKAARMMAVSGKVTIYASSVDMALLASEVKAGRVSRMGYVSEKGPTIIKGIETIDVTAVGNDMFSLNHSHFSSARAVLDDIGRLIMKREHPPHLRTPTLRFMPNDKNPTYWMYPH